jgi:NAD-dependent deacetylase
MGASKLKMEEKTIRKCAELIGKSKRIAVLSGAGISTESGIKDFRSSQGIYKMVPEEVLSLNYFFEHPYEFYQFAFSALYHPDAKPNTGHRILGEWENLGKVKIIITQNIDGLHQKAGSKHVIEFHGTMKTATCLNCGKKYQADELAEIMENSHDFYVCQHCETYREQDRYIKPDVVLFGDTGEWFTQDGFSTIINEIREADCLLVLGTSLKVTPFAHFPRYRQPGVPIIIINKGTTPFDSDPQTYVIQESIGGTLTKIAKLISD